MAYGSVVQSKINYRIHQLYTRGDHDKCLELIDNCLQEADRPPEYYLVFVKAMILRQQGQVTESLKVLEEAVRLDPQNPQNLKQIGRALYLLSKHKIAIDVYDEALKNDDGDWELWHDKGVCYLYLKEFALAEEMFRKSLACEQQDGTYHQLAKSHCMQDSYDKAIDTYVDALKHSSENPELLTQLGLLYLRTGKNKMAFDMLQKSLDLQPTNTKTILALGSIIQDTCDMDSALVQYRTAAVKSPHSAQVWNNVGMCFFGKQRYIAAIACLKRALYLAPFEWIISYNLGLVHINTAQYASAFHYFSSAINLKPTFPHTYMYLGVTLAKLEDFDNACHAYEKAIEKDPSDANFHLNYAVTLYNAGKTQEAKDRYEVFQTLYDKLDEHTKNAEPELAEQASALMSIFG